MAQLSNRITFYRRLAVVFPVFFLLHWNGVLSELYLRMWPGLNTTHFWLHTAAALASSLLIFGVIAGIYECFRAFDSTRGD